MDKRDETIIVPLSQTPWIWDLIKVLQTTCESAYSFQLNDTEAFEVVCKILARGSEGKAAREGLEIDAFGGILRRDGSIFEPIVTDGIRTSLPASQRDTLQVTWRGVPSNVENHGLNGPYGKRYPNPSDPGASGEFNRIKRDFSRMLRLAWSGLSKRQKRRFRGEIREIVRRNPGSFPVVSRFARTVNDPFLAAIERPEDPQVETWEKLLASFGATEEKPREKCYRGRCNHPECH